MMTGDFQKLTDFGNLYRAFCVSCKGSGARRSATRFRVNALENLYIMKQMLLDRTYQLGEYYEFIVSEPKKRVIKAGAFQDKVLQHCLCDSVLLPRLQSIFIRDNYAGQAGKGTLFGLNRLSEQLTEHYRLHGCTGYILKCDIRKFFYSIDHSALKACIRRYFQDDGVQWVCDLFIDSTDDPGLPLGNQCSQVFALMFLDGLDHFITETLGCEFYGRYMDDFYLISTDKEHLQQCLKEIKQYLQQIGLALNEKTEIVSIQKGIRFLGFHTYITDEGKIIRRLTGDNKRQIKKRLRKLTKLVADGKISTADFLCRYESWKNHASHGNCYKLLQSMDIYVDFLFEEYNIAKECESNGVCYRGLSR